MPTMRTKAPSGSALTPYSVSPRRKLHSRGPKKRKNWVAFIPVQRAVRKWPSSWRKIDTTRPTTNTKIQMLTNASHTNRARMAAIASQPCQPPASASSPFSVTAPPAMISPRALPSRVAAARLSAVGGASSLGERSPGGVSWSVIVCALVSVRSSRQHLRGDRSGQAVGVYDVVAGGRGSPIMP